MTDSRTQELCIKYMELAKICMADQNFSQSVNLCLQFLCLHLSSFRDKNQLSSRDSTLRTKMRALVKGMMPTVCEVSYIYLKKSDRLVCLVLMIRSFLFTLSSFSRSVAIYSSSHLTSLRPNNCLKIFTVPGPKPA
jgi:hypothetical protein